MKTITIYHYDAFSKEPNKGNPAGVVLNGDDLTDFEMQEIAYRAGFNETAFLVNSNVADLGIRYFSPGQEMDLCGHGTIAAVYALKSKNLLNDKSKLTIETKVGILPIRIDSQADGEEYITMKQDSPQLKDFSGSYEELANSIGINRDDIESDLPTVYGSTGSWTLLVPIKKLSIFNKMKANNELFPSVLKEIPKASIHPFCLETYDQNADMHARHFSSPYSGTIEDSVTGTASGVMGAYYAEYINRNFENHLRILVEQGHEMGKDGRVLVKVSKNEKSYDIEITGTAVYVKELEIVFVTNKHNKV